MHEMAGDGSALHMAHVSCGSHASRNSIGTVIAVTCTDCMTTSWLADAAKMKPPLYPDWSNMPAVGAQVYVR